MGHDILIRVDNRIKPYIYRVLVNYIGENNQKKNLKESAYKNGIRVIRQNCSEAVSNGKIRKWAQTRLYFAKHTIVIDEKISVAIFDALLKSLYSIPGKKDSIDKVLSNHFEVIKSSTEEYSRRLAILEDIYRIILIDGNNNCNSGRFCDSLEAVEERYN